MRVLSYPYAWLPVVIVFGMLATIGVSFLAFVWLVVFLVVAFAAIVALGWGLVATSRAVGRRLRWRWTLSASVSGSKRSRERA